MRLLRRMYRFLTGKCELCGTKLTNIELELACRICLHCESRLGPV